MKSTASESGLIVFKNDNLMQAYEWNSNFSRAPSSPKIVRQFGLSALTNWHVFHNNNEALDQMVKQIIWYYSALTANYMMTKDSFSESLCCHLNYYTQCK